MMLHAVKVIRVNTNPNEKLKVEYADRGLQYGDGCFTTMYCETNQVTLFNEHIVRLVGDAARLKMFVDISKLKQAIENELQAILTDNTSALAIKLLLTRGAGGRGYEVPLKPLLHLYISVHPCDKQAQYGGSNYRVQTCSFTLARQAMLAGIKHLNRLEQVMAKHELQHLPENTQATGKLNDGLKKERAYVQDLVMLDTERNLVEFTAGNLFFLHNGIWHTPSTDLAGVNGVMRQAFLKYLKATNSSQQVGQYTIDDLLSADALVMCNAIKHLVGVSELLPRPNEDFLPKQFMIKPVEAIRKDFLKYLQSRASEF